MSKKKTKKYKLLQNEFHREMKQRGGRVHRNKKKYHRPSEKNKY